MKAIFWGSLLIFLVLTLWSILAVELLHPLCMELADEGVFHNCERCPRAFSSIEQSVLTFIQTVIVGDSWGVLVVPIVERHAWTAIIFCGVIGTVQLGLMNLILTVIVDRATEARLEDHYFQHLTKEEEFASCKETLTNICKQLDTNSNGDLSKEELFNGASQSLEFANVLKLMDVTGEDLDALFKILDTDHSGTVSYMEFVEQLHRMRTVNLPTLLMLVKHDVLTVHHELRTCMKSVDASLGEAHRALQMLRSSDASPALPEKLPMEPKDDPAEDKFVMEMPAFHIAVNSSGAIAQSTKCSNGLNQVLSSSSSNRPAPPPNDKMLQWSDSAVYSLQAEVARLREQLDREHAEASAELGEYIVRF
jgi:Ca2+-binding EF-hand superfamily protein